MRDSRLEFLSDQVRRGIPISLSEAIEVAQYQSELKKLREKNKSIGWWKRFINLFKK